MASRLPQLDTRTTDVWFDMNAEKRNPESSSSNARVERAMASLYRRKIASFFPELLEKNGGRTTRVPPCKFDFHTVMDVAKALGTFLLYMQVIQCASP